MQMFSWPNHYHNMYRIHNKIFFTVLAVLFLRTFKYSRKDFWTYRIRVNKRNTGFQTAQICLLHSFMYDFNKTQPSYVIFPWCILITAILTEHEVFCTSGQLNRESKHLELVSLKQLRNVTSYTFPTYINHLLKLFFTMLASINCYQRLSQSVSCFTYDLNN